MKNFALIYLYMYLSLVWFFMRATQLVPSKNGNRMNFIIIIDRQK